MKKKEEMYKMTPKTNGLQNVKLQTNPTIFKIEIEENLNVMYEFVFFCDPLSVFFSYRLMFNIILWECMYNTFNVKLKR